MIKDLICVILSLPSRKDQLPYCEILLLCLLGKCGSFRDGGLKNLQLVTNTFKSIKIAGMCCFVLFVAYCA